jgi:hypothetical protein
VVSLVWRNRHVSRAVAENRPRYGRPVHRVRHVEVAIGPIVDIAMIEPHMVGELNLYCILQRTSRAVDVQILNDHVGHCGGGAAFDDETPVDRGPFSDAQKRLVGSNVHAREIDTALDFDHARLIAARGGAQLLSRRHADSFAILAAGDHRYSLAGDRCPPLRFPHAAVGVDVWFRVIRQRSSRAPRASVQRRFPLSTSVTGRVPRGRVTGNTRTEQPTPPARCGCGRLRRVGVQRWVGCRGLAWC